MGIWNGYAGILRLEVSELITPHGDLEQELEA